MNATRRFILACGFMVLPLGTAAAVPTNSADVMLRKDALVPAAFTGTQLLFLDPTFTELAPSVKEINVWSTSTIEIDGYRSSVSTLRVDCGSREFAIVGFAGFRSTFWGGDPAVHNQSNTPPLWKPISASCSLLKSVCTSERSGRTMFYGPNESASCF